MGLFSVLDAVLDRPLPDVLAEVPLAESVRDALLGTPGVNRKILDLVIGFERGGWECLERLIGEMRGTDEAIPDLYVSALGWTRESFASSHA